jgi:ankyrin repeat protein
VDAAVDGLGHTPLGAAARRGDDAEVRRLLGAGAVVDAAPAQVPALRPLLLAAVGGHAAVARLLREAGAAPLDGASAAGALRAAASDEVKVLLREHGATLTLSEECRDGNVAAIAALLDGGADVEGEGEGAKTPLCSAATGGQLEAVQLLLDRGAKLDGDSGAAALRAAASDEVKVLLRDHGATLTLLEECRDGNVAAIAALLDGGADVEAGTSEERRPTVGDEVLIVSGKGAGSVATITRDYEDSEPYQLQGASCGSDWYTEAQVSQQVTALTAAAAGGHVAAVRLLLDRGATAGGASGAAALRAAASDEIKTLLREHGAPQ